MLFWTETYSVLKKSWDTCTELCNVVGTLRFSLVPFKFWVDKASKLQSNETHFSLVYNSWRLLIAVLWLTGTFTHTDNNMHIIYTSHVGWKARRRIVDGTSKVTCDWRRLLLRKAWETEKQALPLVTWFSLPVCPVQFCVCRDWFQLKPAWAAITASSLFTAPRK